MGKKRGSPDTVSNHEAKPEREQYTLAQLAERRTRFVEISAAAIVAQSFVAAVQAEKAIRDLDESIEAARFIARLAALGGPEHTRERILLQHEAAVQDRSWVAAAQLQQKLIDHDRWVAEEERRRRDEELAEATPAELLDMLLAAVGRLPVEGLRAIAHAVSQRLGK